MSNKTVAAKLFVYGREKNHVLIPTCGFGDYLYYAMWISGAHALSSSGISYAFVAFMVFPFYVQYWHIYYCIIKAYKIN